MKSTFVRLLLISSMIMIVSACQNQQSAQESEQLLHLSNNSTAIDQSRSHEYEEIIKRNPEIQEAEAVNGDKEMLLAYAVKQANRFRMEEIDKKLKSQLSHMDPPPIHEVTLSSDQKLLNEVKKLKKELAEKDLSKKEMNDRIKKLIMLSYETT
ncbi:hypothetical protein G4V62_04535 [Bacillaceae bacterium SIJ1]|uniref:YhcN/YlaJ family sporulation lipoprotein n=1 Tax=Litoribacterium kuwaitense TaxID=1398745 RepID=UPI0013EBF42D|nr:YhcN/YlaJ family sporulation lipoprotein [Litoribacterium kuwaitense]NGP44253.1 hypothetical protein [Litoribacterium kuwaitense]